MAKAISGQGRADAHADAVKLALCFVLLQACAWIKHSGSVNEIKYRAGRERQEARYSGHVLGSGSEDDLLTARQVAWDGKDAEVEERYNHNLAPPPRAPSNNILRLKYTSVYVARDAVMCECGHWRRDVRFVRRYRGPAQDSVARPGPFPERQDSASDWPTHMHIFLSNRIGVLPSAESKISNLEFPIQNQEPRIQNPESTPDAVGRHAADNKSRRACPSPASSPWEYRVRARARVESQLERDDEAACRKDKS
ncbi:hypothetical protein B0H11DRAFT_1903049 [Mycena galericulata]|nr:hypothetical protein B0H11DRAFT_1903049 [Mycena galericulata]